ncbi:MAG: low affinity iron permease family protein [Actinobacteria bacterium]|nr:MAG: low affinity iron permease family protein [Actinomycetota bacterium]
MTRRRRPRSCTTAKATSSASVVVSKEETVACCRVNEPKGNPDRPAGVCCPRRTGIRAVQLFSIGPRGREVRRVDHERKVGRFDAFASAAARITGHAAAATAAFVIILVWAVSGPIFGFSDTWQLIINTATTVLTFLMVFVIQNTINRDSLAMHVKLDELIRATDEARNRMIGSEKLSETVLDQLEHEEEQEAES